jgi:hypothetical protein
MRQASYRNMSVPITPTLERIVGFCGDLQPNDGFGIEVTVWGVKYP